MDVKIISWKSKGLRIPDWEINLDPSNGKKTCINDAKWNGQNDNFKFIRYSFCDYSKIVEKQTISSLQKEEQDSKGEFILNIKINNEKYRIKTIFDFNKKSII